MERRIAEIAPKTGLLIASRRDIGYSLETALSDIIDNSIAVGADTIEILVDPSASPPQIAIRDNGCGMSEEELLDAMWAALETALVMTKTFSPEEIDFAVMWCEAKQVDTTSGLDTRLSEGLWKVDAQLLSSRKDAPA